MQLISLKKNRQKGMIKNERKKRKARKTAAPALNFWLRKRKIATQAERRSLHQLIETSESFCQSFFLDRNFKHLISVHPITNKKSNRFSSIKIE